MREKTDRRFLDRMLAKHADALEGVVSAYTRDVERHRPIQPNMSPRSWTKKPPATLSSP
ncbi:hypothetical protein ACWDA3_27900 [Nonomuraea rubra]